MKKIKIDIRNVTVGIREIEKYRDNLKKKNKMFIQKLAEKGIDIATLKYNKVEYDGVNDVSVKSTPTWISDNKLVIEATGNSIGFIEFGTGIYNPVHHPKESEFGAMRGAYGKGKGKNIAWGYYGDSSTANAGGRSISTKNGNVVVTTGNNANMSMYLTGKELREQILKIAREVFADD